MSDYRLTARADLDLTEILLYTEREWGVDQAEAYLTIVRPRLYQACVWTTKWKTFRSAVPRHEIRFEGLSVGKHFAFFRKYLGMIEIVAVIHSGRFELIMDFLERES